jgi:copper chaperone NosL
MTLQVFHRKMDHVERPLVALAGALMLASLMLPIWHVHLWAPQYPEGMDLWISARTITGNLQNINILNHYIGMKPISVASFPEFLWMTPVLAALGIVIMLTALSNRREGLLVTGAAVVAFNAFMLWDLFHWMYLWGHELDPHAAITVAPFTPPTFGIEHIANFYVTSFPSFGGVLVMLATLIGGLAAWHAWRSSPSAPGP